MTNSNSQTNKRWTALSESPHLFVEVCWPPCGGDELLQAGLLHPQRSLDVEEHHGAQHVECNHVKELSPIMEKETGRAAEALPAHDVLWLKYLLPSIINRLIGYIYGSLSTTVYSELGITSYYNTARLNTPFWLGTRCWFICSMYTWMCSFYYMIVSVVAINSQIILWSYV